MHYSCSMNNARGAEKKKTKQNTGEIISIQTDTKSQLLVTKGQGFCYPQ